jgi:hypothetical protein
MGSILQCPHLVTVGVARHIFLLLPLRIKGCFFTILIGSIPLHHVILFKALLCSYKLNTLDAGRSRSMFGVIVVDTGRSRSTCHGRDAYIHDHCLGYLQKFALYYQLLNSNLFTHRMLSSREKPLVKPMAPGSIFHHIFSHL